MNLGKKAMVGLVLMVVGLALLLPAASPTAGLLAVAVLLPATASLVYGTWLVGTSIEGQVV